MGSIRVKFCKKK